MVHWGLGRSLQLNPKPVSPQPHHRANLTAPVSLLKRIIEILLALALTSICGLTGWLIWDGFAHPPEPSPPLATLLSILLVLGFIMGAGLLWAVRLAFPSLRGAEGRVIGRRGLMAFGLLYGFTLLLGLLAGHPEARTGALAILLGIVLAIAWRTTFGRRGSGDAAG